MEVRQKPYAVFDASIYGELLHVWIAPITLARSKRVEIYPTRTDDEIPADFEFGCSPDLQYSLQIGNERTIKLG